MMNWETLKDARGWRLTLQRMYLMNCRFFLSADYADFRRFLGFFKGLFFFGFPLMR
jgi:hypothetical protein